MKNRVDINYQPAFSHAVIKASIFMLAIVSFLDFFLTITTYVRYGYASPIEIHLAPLTLVLLLGISIKLIQPEQETYRYSIRLFGITVYRQIFSVVTLEKKGKFITLVGHKPDGQKYQTFITEPVGTGLIIFNQFSESHPL